MFLHRLDGYLLPVEDPRGQGGFHIGLFKDFRKVFHLSGTGRGNDRDGNVFANVFHKFNVKTTSCAVLINTVEELSMVSPESLRMLYDG